MGTIQSALAVYSVVEGILRRAMNEFKPRTANDIWADPEVQKVATNRQQMSDALTKFRQKEMLVKVSMRGRPGYTNNEIGYMWNSEWHAEPNAVKKPSPVVVTKPEIKQVQNAQEIELEFGQTRIVIGQNKQTGRIRIIIEG